MRQWVKTELTRLKLLLAAYKATNSPTRPCRVVPQPIPSRHYGQVFTSDDEPLPIDHALAGTIERPTRSARVFSERLFASGTSRIARWVEERNRPSTATRFRSGFKIFAGDLARK